jgi:hypothetical protein
MKPSDGQGWRPSLVAIAEDDLAADFTENEND